MLIRVKSRSSCWRSSLPLELNVPCRLTHMENSQNFFVSTSLLCPSQTFLLNFWNISWRNSCGQLWTCLLNGNISLPKKNQDSSIKPCMDVRKMGGGKVILICRSTFILLQTAWTQEISCLVPSSLFNLTHIHFCMGVFGWDVVLNAVCCSEISVNYSALMLLSQKCKLSFLKTPIQPHTITEHDCSW